MARMPRVWEILPTNLSANKENGGRSFSRSKLRERGLKLERPQP
jgi:hypothetical protein